MPKATLNKPVVDFAAMGPFDDPYDHLDPFKKGLRHLYSASQFSDPKLLEVILDRAEEIKRQLSQGLEVDTPLRARPTSRKKGMYLLFVDSPSTRTIHSTQRAATLLGMDTVADQSLSGSSMKKGESWEHTIIALCAMLPDVFAIRARDPKFIWRAMQVSSVPVINCGGGNSGEHPTQALGDQYLIRDRLGRLDNLRIVVVGDLRASRVVRSNLLIWSSYPNNSFDFFSSRDLSLAEDIRANLDKSGAEYHEHFDRKHLHEAMSQADIVYVMTDVKQALSGNPKYQQEADIDDLVIDWADADTMRPQALLMHPLPNAGEMRPRLDFHPRSVYAPEPGSSDIANQMTAGLVTRMAAFEWVFGYIN